MTFSDDAWQRIAPLYAAILELPFNRELAAGTLSRERFTFYMLQDAHYLTHFGKALAVTAARAPDADALIQFAGSAREAVVVERALHEGFFRDFGIAPAEAAATEPSPTCAHYTHYLVALAHNAPYEVAVAALLPCFWIYWEVGKHLRGVAAPGNPYQAWIDTYADEAFARRRAAGDRAQRPDRGRGDATGPWPDAPGLPPRRPARMDVLGQRLAPRGLARLAGGSAPRWANMVCLLKDPDRRVDEVDPRIGPRQRLVPELGDLTIAGLACEQVGKEVPFDA